MSKQKAFNMSKQETFNMRKQETFNMFTSTYDLRYLPHDPLGAHRHAY